MNPSACNTTTSQSQETPPPRLCTGGCGIFGSSENRGLCSMCYLAYLKQDEVSPSKIQSPKERESISPAERGRCGSCNKKVGLLGFVCKCEGSFCSLHRYPESHACKFDFKSVGRAVIEKQNPICKSDKISRRI